MTPDPKHVEYLSVVLYSLAIVAEDRFDRLALEYLRHFQASSQLDAIKTYLLDHQHAHRLELRGKLYLVRTRINTHIENIAVMTMGDVVYVLERFAMLHEELTQPQAKRQRW